MSPHRVRRFPPTALLAALTSRMKFLNSFSTIVLFAACSTAYADGGGTLYINGVATQLTSAYAYAAPDAFDDSKQMVVVVLSTAAIDAAAYDAAEDRAKAIRSSLVLNSENKPTTVTLKIGPAKDKPIRGIDVDIMAGEGKHFSGTWVSYVLDLKQNDGKRIEGTFRTTDEKKSAGTYNDYYDLHFALNVASGPRFGPGLPPDGGEPFKGYWKYVSALWSVAIRDELDDEKVRVLANTLTEARIKAVDKIAESAGKGAGALDKAELAVFKKMWADVPHGNRSVNSSDVVFVNGRVKGDVATLEIKGERSEGKTDGNGEYTPGPPIFVTVTMKKESGQWCFDNDRVHAPAAAPKK